MAAFSYPHHHSFLLDSFFQPNTPLKMMFPFPEEPNTTFSHFYPAESFNQIPFDISANNELSEQVINKNCTDQSSSVADYKHEDSDQVVTKRVITANMDKKRKMRDGFSSTSSVQYKDAKEVKGKRPRKRNGLMKNDEENNGECEKKDKKKVLEESPKDYIHVRARRGQATDSHSLAERVRREKISERMKVLQTLVPGCDKVTGKALMLDEIINYVQSLQNQVEFLSMRLASMNPMFYDFGMDLDSLMVPPKRLNKLVSPISLSNGQKYNSALQTAFSNHATTSPSSCYPQLFPQGQRTTFIPPEQENGQILLDIDDRRQKLANQSSYIQQLVGFPLI